MARIDWAQLCELAFLDNHHRLCLVGITTRVPVPSLPSVVHQLMIAARIVDVQQGDELDFEVSTLTPRGRSSGHDQSGLDITVAGDYLLITLRDVRLTEEGVYRFGISAGTGDAVWLDVTVMLSDPGAAEVH
jgi:hypothetical protein